MIQLDKTQLFLLPPTSKHENAVVVQVEAIHPE